mmetsp:Transcript_7525/g.24065  ORF Transcript_7525/g.24065 Transcript_7525/m.24065 type:complete len:200 (+) Transcript_7525:274-873(+)
MPVATSVRRARSSSLGAAPAVRNVTFFTCSSPGRRPTETMGARSAGRWPISHPPKARRMLRIKPAVARAMTAGSWQPASVASSMPRRAPAAQAQGSQTPMNMREMERRKEGPRGAPGGGGGGKYRSTWRSERPIATRPRVRLFLVADPTRWSYDSTHGDPSTFDSRENHTMDMVDIRRYGMIMLAKQYRSVKEKRGLRM